MLCESCLESVSCQSDVSFDMAVFLGNIRSVHELTCKAVVVQRAISSDSTVTLLLRICTVGIVHSCISYDYPGCVIGSDFEWNIDINYIRVGYIAVSAGFMYVVGARYTVCVVVCVSV